MATKLLGRAFGEPRKPAQDARTRAGLGVLRAPNEGSGVALGALVATVLGPPSSGSGQATRVLGAPRGCRDCGEPVVNPLASQPLRCRPCGKAKRQEHNENYSARLRAEQGTIPADEGGE